MSYLNRRIGIWLSPPPQLELLAVGLMDEGENIRPSADVRAEEGIVPEPIRLSDRICFVAYVRGGNNCVGVDIKPAP